MLGQMISGNPDLLEPLSTTLGLEDLHDLFEVRTIDAYNQRRLNEWAHKNRGE